MPISAARPGADGMGVAPPGSFEGISYSDTLPLSFVAGPVPDAARLAGLNPAEMDLEIVNARLTDKNQVYTDFLYERLQRSGYLRRDCQRLINNDRNVFAAAMVAMRDADGMVTGVTRSFDVALEGVRVPASESKADDDSLVLEDLHRLEHKVNVLIQLVAKLVAREQSMPAPAAWRLYATGIEWQADAAPALPDSSGQVLLYVSRQFPQPLRLPGKMQRPRQDETDHHQADDDQ